MKLYTILLVVVGILTMLTGISVFLGSRKAEKAPSRFFMLTTFCAALWAIAIAIFTELKPDTSEFMTQAVVFLVYGPALFMDVCMLTYVTWPYKIMRYVSVVVATIAVIMCSAIIFQPGLLYTGVTLSNSGNAVTLLHDWFYWAYTSFFVVITLAVEGCLIHRAFTTKNKGQRRGHLVFLVGITAMGTLSLIFDVLLPFFVRYDLIWIGPFMMGLAMIAYYYAILRYKMLQVSTHWLKFLSYVILICTGAIIYMIIFYIIFTALFKVPNPSSSIFVLNFIMITIVLLLFPVISELSAFIRSLIQTNQVDLAYIVKKLNTMTTNVNLNELADFLADHMHFSYIGLVVNGKLYGSSALPLAVGELKQITLLKSSEKGGIWQEFNEPVAEIFNQVDVKACAELRDAKGKPFGQILVGKPLGKMGFERRDLIQLEMIVNLVAAMIDTKAK